MPLEMPDFRRRAELSELMDQPCSREQMRACLRDLAKLNRWFLGYRPLLKWLDSLFPALTKLGRGTRTEPVRILDVGCGYGDGLRRIAQWAKARGVAVNLTGLDVNPDTIAVAAEVDVNADGVEWVCADVFAYVPPHQIDLIFSSLFTHHLRDAEVVQFIEWMEQRASLGWFVNDLSRSAVPYYLLAAFTKVARMHEFVQHDAPVSIARAFRPEDWKRKCGSAGLLSNEYEILAYTPARLCVARRKR